MTKRVICLFLAVLTLISVFAIGVSAKEYYYEDFENATPSYADNKAHFYMTIPNLQNGTPTAEYKVTDGMFHFEKSSYAQAEQTAISNKVPEIRLNYDKGVADVEEFFIELDFMFGDNALMNGGGEIIIYAYMHDKRFGAQLGFKGMIFNFGQAGSLPVLQKNVWYTGLYHIRMADGVVDAYQKVKGEDEYIYVQSASLEQRTSNNYYLQLYGDYRKDQDIYIDNVKIYDGLVSKGGFFEMDGAKIDGVDGVQAGTLTANATVLCGDVTSEDHTFSAKQVVPVLTVFDGNGRLVDCQVKTDFELTAGTNEISIDYDVSEYGDSVSGGYVGFYLWKDMTSVRPVIEPIELN